MYILSAIIILKETTTILLIELDNIKLTIHNLQNNYGNNFRYCNGDKDDFVNSGRFIYTVDNDKTKRGKSFKVKTFSHDLCV